MEKARLASKSTPVRFRKHPGLFQKVKPVREFPSGNRFIDNTLVHCQSPADTLSWKISPTSFLERMKHDLIQPDRGGNTEFGMTTGVNAQVERRADKSDNEEEIMFWGEINQCEKDFIEHIFPDSHVCVFKPYYENRIP